MGGYWGLFDGAERKLKYPAGVAISNYPFWKLQMAGGLVLCIGVFAVALFCAEAPAVAAAVGIVGRGRDLRDHRRDIAGHKRRQDASRKLWGSAVGWCRAFCSRRR